MDKIEYKHEERPWGWFISTFCDLGIKTKIIYVKPRSRLSLQSHNHRSEMWTIIRGNGLCTIGNEKIEVHENSFVNIKVGVIHRIENTSDSEPIIFSEVQTGQYLEDYDITRYEDDYGRS